MKRILVWFRNDLRLHDHTPLQKALREADEIVPVYCFDPRHFQGTAYGWPKTGNHRTRFLRESVSALDQCFREKGGKLLIATGYPEEVVARLAGEWRVQAVYCHAEIASEEVAVEQKLAAALRLRNIPLKTEWGNALFQPEDIPFPPENVPEVFTAFRKKTENRVPVRTSLPAPDRVAVPPELPDCAVPAWEWFGQQPPVPDPRAVLTFTGGEPAGLQRVHYYIWESEKITTYKVTRNGLLGSDYSSKFSPWLALGCVSPRQIYHEIKRFESVRLANESTYWLIFELLWREYFRLIARKAGTALFRTGGIRGRAPRQPFRNENLARWVSGSTGVPFVDANMRELDATGFISNRGRQNVASYLVHDLGVNWVLGAAYFESRLIDYDVYSNWGNWNYIAGVGNDPRENRYFNVHKQASTYDPQGEYVRHWGD